MNTQRITKTLTCHLSEEEVKERSHELIEKLEDLDTVELERKAANDKFKERHKALDLRTRELRRQIEKRTQLRDIECELRVDGTNQLILTVRLDTNQVIDARPMTEQERQRDFIFDHADAEINRRDNQTLAGLLEMIKDQTARLISTDEVAAWTDDEYKEVERWVGLSLMQGTMRDEQKNTIDVPPMPQVLSGAPSTDDSTENNDVAPDAPNDTSTADEPEAESDNEALARASERGKLEKDARDEGLMIRLAEENIFIPYDTIAAWSIEDWNDVSYWVRERKTDLTLERPRVLIESENNGD